MLSKAPDKTAIDSPALCGNLHSQRFPCSSSPSACTRARLVHAVLQAQLFAAEAALASAPAQRAALPAEQSVLMLQAARMWCPRQPQLPLQRPQLQQLPAVPLLLL
jgi:hypothetical protein